MKDFKKYLAEFIGTFVLVLVACGVGVKSGCNGTDVPAAIITALAFGGVIVAMAYSIGNISGCHINPAVSVAVLINGGMTVKEFIGYVIAQYLGATAGAAVLGVLNGCSFTGLATNSANGHIGIALLAEVLLTCVFVLAVLGATSKPENGKVAGLVIGGSLTLVHLLGIFITGTSVNPARSFGPALMDLFGGGNAIADYWIFLVGPMVGGVLAALLWKVLNCKCAKKAK